MIQRVAAGVVKDDDKSSKGSSAATGAPLFVDSPRPVLDGGRDEAVKKEEEIAASPPPALRGSKRPPESVEPLEWGRRGKRSGQRKRKLAAGKSDVKVICRREEEGPLPQKRRLMTSAPELRAEEAHSLELKAYSYAVKAVYLSKEPLAREQQALLMSFRRLLHISPEEQRAELLRVMMSIQRERVCHELFGC